MLCFFFQLYVYNQSIWIIPKKLCIFGAYMTLLKLLLRLFIICIFVHLFNFFLYQLCSHDRYIFTKTYITKNAYHVVLVLCFYISFFLLLLASVSTSLTKSNNKQFILNQINFGKIFTRWNWWTNNNKKNITIRKKNPHHIKIQFTYKICAMKYI